MKITNTCTDCGYHRRLRLLPASIAAALFAIAVTTGEPVEAASSRTARVARPTVEGVDPAQILLPTQGAVSSAQAVKAAPAGSRIYSVSLKQLGAAYPLKLRGVQGSGGVPFSVRADEVVVGAKLKLRYAYSPALLPDISHINVRVNQEIAVTLPVPKDKSGVDLEQDIELPTRLITDFNRLDLELIGHYTLDCEDPQNTSLWASISNLSTIELTVAPVALPDDLALLPGPMFDRRDVRPLLMPFVFMSSPVPTTLEAAGNVASWFGALASYRGARFPSAVGTLPAKGSAVVFTVGPNAGIPGVELPGLAGPTLAMVTNPNDPTGKLLVVSGRDAAELKIAASALTLGSSTLSGRVATVGELREINPRKPYDAPNWLPSDRAVRFGELADKSALTVSGYAPDLVRINFRTAPDLFAWRQKGVAVDLRYRYTPRPSSDKSTLNLDISGQFLRSYPLRAINHDAPGVIEKLLPSPEDGTIMAREQLSIPMSLIAAQSQLQFHFYYDYIKQGYCKDVILDNVRGAIDPDSTIDASGFSHFLAMPDLAAFSNTGFPFTRMADLSQTAVVLADKAEAVEWTTFLDVMGLMGRSTGYPATGVSVLHENQVDNAKDKDLIVVSLGANQPLVKRWEKLIPSTAGPTVRRFQLSDLTGKVVDFWDGQHRQVPVNRRDELQFSGSGPQAAISGFESPVASGRSVVLISADQPEALEDAVNALLDVDLVKLVQGSTVVVRGQQVTSLAAEQTYHSGNLNPITWVQWFLSRHPILMVLAGVLGAALLALVMYVILRSRSRRRLND